MSWRDYLARPDDVLKSPLQVFNTDAQPGMQKRPWLQASSRNFAHAVLGDKIASGVESRVLGDLPVGQTNGMGQTPQMTQPGQLMMPVGPLNQSQGQDAAMMALQQFLQRR